MIFATCVILVAPLLAVKGVSAQSDATESIRNTLTAKYALTTTTSDRMDFVTTGAVVVPLPD